MGRDVIIDLHLGLTDTFREQGEALPAPLNLLGAYRSEQRHAASRSRTTVAIHEFHAVVLTGARDAMGRIGPDMRIVVTSTYAYRGDLR